MKLLPFFLLSVALLFTQCKFFESTTESKGAPKPGGGGSASMSKETRLRSDIANYAQKFKGKPYLYAGKSPSTGFDCSGFTYYVMSNFDISVSPSSREQAKQGRSKPVNQAKAGDLVFFRRSPGTPIFHVALVLSAGNGTLKVIHSTTSRGVIVEDVMASTYWKPYIDSVRDVVRQ